MAYNFWPMAAYKWLTNHLFTADRLEKRPRGIPSFTTKRGNPDRAVQLSDEDLAQYLGAPLNVAPKTTTILVHGERGFCFMFLKPGVFGSFQKKLVDVKNMVEEIGWCKTCG